MPGSKESFVARLQRVKFYKVEPRRTPSRRENRPLNKLKRAPRSAMVSNYGSRFSYRNKWAGDLISEEEKPSVL
jgi:hypothetical protein